MIEFDWPIEIAPDPYSDYGSEAGPMMSRGRHANGGKLPAKEWLVTGQSVRFRRLPPKTLAKQAS